MSKKTYKPRTEAQKIARRERDRKRREALKKQAKKSIVVKPTGKKVVKAVVKQSVQLPKPPAQKIIEAKPIVKHIVRKGDIIAFDGFESEDILKYATRLQILAMAAMAEKIADSCKCTNPCKKCGKK